MKYFVREWKGYQICIGPDANAEGDPYEHCIPLRDTGEFGGYSTTRLTTKAKRTATEAAISLGFQEPFWRNREGKITMAIKKTKLHSIFDPAGLDAEGYLKPAVAKVALHHIIEQVEAGHWKIQPVLEPPDGADGEVIFRRKAVDPAVVAAPAPILKA
jgi:hypothetical protein